MALVRPLLNIPAVRSSPGLRSFLTAAWLGWQIESNWASPFLFAIYSIARPIAGALIIVVIYSVITNGATDQPLFAYIFLGNALHLMVTNVVSGISWVVVDDREHYRVAKQLHTSPISYYTYLLGRGVARMGIGAVSVIITILFGVLFFQLPLRLSGIDWALFISSTLFALIAMQAIGVILGALTMHLGQRMWSLGEGVVTAFYLYSGAIFPLEALPENQRWIGFLYPITYWLELARRALLGENAPTFPTFSPYTSQSLLLILIAMSLTLIILSYGIYRWSLHQAKEKGRLDMETNY